MKTDSSTTNNSTTNPDQNRPKSVRRLGGLAGLVVGAPIALTAVSPSTSALSPYTTTTSRRAGRNIVTDYRGRNFRRLGAVTLAIMAMSASLIVVNAGPASAATTCVTKSVSYALVHQGSTRGHATAKASWCYNGTKVTSISSYSKSVSSTTSDSIVTTLSGTSFAPKAGSATAEWSLLWSIKEDRFLASDYHWTTYADGFSGICSIFELTASGTIKTNGCSFKSE